MITKFQALVARESMLECFTSDDDAVTVVKIRECALGKWLLLCEYSDGSRFYRSPEQITPCATIDTLISNRTYREDTMTWHAVIDGQSFVGHLTY